MRIPIHRSKNKIRKSFCICHESARLKIPFGISTGKSISSTFLAFRGHLHPCMMVPSSIFRINSISSSNLSLMLTFQPPFYKDLCDYIGPVHITQNNFKIFKLTKSAKSLFTKQGNVLTCLGINMWTFLGGHYFDYPEGHIGVHYLVEISWK